MNRENKTLVVAACVTMLLLAMTKVASAQHSDAVPRRPKIAIGSFEYKGPPEFRTRTDAFSEMVSTALMRTRRFDMVERQRVNEALKEMGLGEAGIVDPNDSQKFGTLIKADLLLFGTITQASLEERKVMVDGLNTATHTMRMAVDIRVIDAETGEVRTAETIERSKVAAKSVVVRGGAASSQSSSGLVGDVMRDVANEVVLKLVETVFPIKATLVTDDGRVRLDAGDQMVSMNGVYDVMDADGFPTGKIRITGVFPRYSTAQVIEGNVAEGSICRKSQQPETSSKPPVQDIPW